MNRRAAIYLFRDKALLGKIWPGGAPSTELSAWRIVLRHEDGRTGFLGHDEGDRLLVRLMSGFQRIDRGLSKLVAWPSESVTAARTCYLLTRATDSVSIKGGEETVMAQLIRAIANQRVRKNNALRTRYGRATIDEEETWLELTIDWRRTRNLALLAPLAETVSSLIIWDIYAGGYGSYPTALCKLDEVPERLSELCREFDLGFVECAEERELPLW